MRVWTLLAAMTLTSPLMARPLTPLLAAGCDDSNIANVKGEVIDDPNNYLYKITITFKNVILADSGQGVDRLACSLYSKLPPDFTGSSAGLYSTRYEFKGNAPANLSIKGSAAFEAGVIQAGSLHFSGNNHFVVGTVKGRQTGPQPEAMMMMRRINPIDNPGDGSAMGTASGLLGVDGGGTLDSTQAQSMGIDINDSEAVGGLVEDGKLIVNNLNFTLTGQAGTRLGTSVELKSVEIIIKAM